MYHWIMKAKNGGLSIVTTRYERATNLASEIARGYFEETYQTQEFYDPNGETIRLYYIDANQLYPECMIHKLPISGYHFLYEKWDTSILMEKDRLLNIGYKAKEDEPWRKQGDKGWFLEISGHFPIEIYKKDEVILKMQVHTNFKNGYAEDAGALGLIVPTF